MAPKQLLICDKVHTSQYRNQHLLQGLFKMKNPRNPPAIVLMNGLPVMAQDPEEHPTK